MNYTKAIEEVKLRRKNAQLANEQRIIFALRSDDDLRKTDIEIRTLEQAVRTNAKDEAKNKQQLAALKKRRNEMFSRLNLSETVPYFCQTCQDTGIIENGKPCSCVISMAADGDTPLYSFEDSDLSVFKPEDRERAGKVYQAMLGFCQKFPFTNSKNLILAGKTGTGKTFLASCAASYLQQRGFSVLFVSAFDFVNRMLKYYTAPIDEKLDHLLPLIDCDLLIIDDIGTENILKNVTIECFYNVLNERMRTGRHLMITTNLDKDGLAERYGERIFSRLCDKRQSALIVLAENDLRRG